MKADPPILHRKLKDFFGYDAFKGDQEAIITHLVEGKNAFVLMPTGGGWYFKDDEKKTMILYGGSGDFGRADLAFLNRIWKFRRKVTPFFSYERDPLFRLKVIPWS